MCTLTHIHTHTYTYIGIPLQFTNVLDTFSLFPTAFDKNHGYIYFMTHEQYRSQHIVYEK